ncbi:MAG TPA: VOC family protein [Candidatus Acidoferrum sp.]|jgi:catechol 2,3-dioxygenase-like lactoylglutathione lyase family enzyme|nr:VOC family protein [Candidatus Acidoferrum sp.]
MPSLSSVLETSLYVDDLDRASRFYEETFGLTRIEGDQRFRAYSVGGRSVLLLFKRGASNRVTQLPEGTLGPHDGSGPLHLAFSISAEDLPAWEQLLVERGIAVETRIRWPRGGTSIYFRDPDNHSLELATPGVWSIY